MRCTTLNNHPFLGSVKGTDFALAHNGMLRNDKLLRESEKLPKTHIQTDSYVAVQLIEKEKSLGFESIKNIAEKTEGSFVYTVLNDKNELYIVKGDNPIALYKFDGFYIYASTDNILCKALEKLNLSGFDDIDIGCGDIVKINSDGIAEVGHFDFKEDFYGGYGRYFIESDKDYLEELAYIYGIEPEDLQKLFDFGLDEFDIEEMLWGSGDLHSCICEAKGKAL